MPEAVSTPAAADRHGEQWHRRLLEELCAFERETASAGEHAAAQWLVEQLAAAGASDARIEEERGHQTFWWPLGLTAVAACSPAHVGCGGGAWALRRSERSLPGRPPTSCRRVGGDCARCCRRRPPRTSSPLSARSTRATRSCLS